MLGSTKLLLRATCALALTSAALMPAAHAEGVFNEIKVPVTAALTEKADSAPMRVILSLPLRDEAGLKDFIAHVSNPSDPLYGHYLTAKEFAARFGTDPALHAAVRAWAINAGLKVNDPVSSRAIVSVAGTAKQFAAIFGTKFATFHTPLRGDGQVTLSTPKLPDALAGKVSGVIGLSYAQHDATLFHVKSNNTALKDPGNGTGANGGYAPVDLRNGYQISAQTSTAKTETVGIFEQGGYVASDVTKFESQYKLKAVPVTQISVNNAGTASTSALLEDLLDIDVLVGLNNSLAGIRLYTDGVDSFQVALLDALNDMATDQLCSVISISYGQSEAGQGTSAIIAENTAFEQLAAQGQSVFVSSGDGDAAANDPASQPYVTSVGGTTLNLTAGATETWVSETVWNTTPGSAGTGGGISGVWTIPSYQVIKGVSVAAANGGSSTMRNIPDVAAVADPNTGYTVYCVGFFKCGGFSGWDPVGGTSLASPVWAAMTSVLNADRVAKHLPRVGWYNPTIYGIASSSTGVGIHDVTVGNNTGFNAGPGYDNATGWGSQDFAVYITNQSVKP